ncbi:MAG: hypothetical protein MUF46_11385 [Desulfobacterales bacterium]|nr:hypothetical protein [Desulfobacterales bacterium]
MQLVELFHRVAADDEIDPGVKPALGHQSDACGLGLWVQVMNGLAVVGADQGDAGLDGGLEGVQHQGQGQKIDGGVDALPQEADQLRPGGGIDFDRGDLGGIGARGERLPALQARIRADDFPDPPAACEVENGVVAAMAAVNRYRAGLSTWKSKRIEPLKGGQTPLVLLW